MKDLDKLIKKLRETVEKKGLEYEGDSIIKQIEDNNNSKKAIEPIFKIIEEYKDRDLGMPGPLVRFLEGYYKNGYEEELIKSLERKPTWYTVWMLNRLINGEEGCKRKYLEEKMVEIGRLTELNKDTYELVQDLLKER